MRPGRSPSKSVSKRDSKEKIANAIDRLDLLYTPFINHGDYGGSSRRLWIRNELLVAWRRMEDPPPSEQAGYLSEV